MFSVFILCVHGVWCHLSGIHCLVVNWLITWLWKPPTMGYAASFACLWTDNMKMEASYSGTHSIFCLHSTCSTEIMIADIEFSIAHEPVETGIGILERATKDTSPFSDTGNKTSYVPSLQGSIRKSIWINSSTQKIPPIWRCRARQMIECIRNTSASLTW